MTNCFIINRDRLGCTQKMVEYLKLIPEINPIIIDNGSTYEPLLDWYVTNPCEIDMVGKNSGEAVLWVTDRINSYNLAAGNYIVTDSDLDISHIPLDFLSVLRNALDKHPWAFKAGFSLRIHDLPETPIKGQVLQAESAHWGDPLRDNIYRAAIDTTFALYRNAVHSFDCVRVGAPYDAIHLNWYYKDLRDLPPDEIHYLKGIKPKLHSYWSTLVKEHYKL